MAPNEEDMNIVIKADARQAKREFVSLEALGRRLQGTFSKAEAAIVRGTRGIQATSGTKFSKDLFVGFEDFQKQVEMFGQNSQKSFSTTTRAAKVMSEDVSSSIKEGEANFKKVQGVWAKESSISAKAQEKLAKEAEKAAHVIGRSWARQGKYASESIKEIGDITKDLDKQINKNKFKFQGWALSVLFFGQALQRTFTQIAKFGTSTFQEIAHSVEGVVTNSDMLEGSIKYLGFTIGEALEPVIGWLIPIIDAIATWVEEHPKLTAAIVTTGIVLGTLLSLIGAGVLAVAGLKEGFSVLFGKEFVDKITEGQGLWGKFTDSLKGTFEYLKGLSLAQSLGLGLVIAGIVLVIAWIWKMQEAMGGWGEFFKSVARGVLRVWGMIAGVIGGLLAEIVNTFKVIWNAVLSLLEDGLNWLIKKINKLIEAFNSLPFVGNIPLVPEVNFAPIVADTKKFGDAFLDEYVKSMNIAFEIEQKYLTPAKGYATGSAGGIPTYGNQPQQATNNLYVQEMVVQNPAGYDDMMKEINKNMTILMGMQK